MKGFLKKKIVVAIAVALAAVGGYQYWKSRNSGPAAAQYVTAKVARGTLVVSVAGSGQISASNQTNIQAQSSGVVTEIPVQDNQKVSEGQLLVQLDTTNDNRAARNAGVNLQSAELQLQTLEQPATTSTLLQAEEANVQAQQNFKTANGNLANDYSNSYTDISNTFIDLPAAMTGLNNMLYGTYLNKVQGDIDAYSNLISYYYPNVSQYNQSAASSYAAAVAAYNQNLSDYKNSSVYSGTSTIESLLGETYATLQSVSVANGDAKNLLDLVYNTLQQNNQKIPAQLNSDESGVQSYITTTNSHLSAILQITNVLQADKQAIVGANLSVGQTAAALEQLRNSPTDLQIQAQELAITQAKNALADAKANLDNDYVRAPFAGIVTNIAAKIGQPAGGTLAVLVSSAQLAQATLNETDVVNVKLGQKATVTFDALPDLTLTGKVSEIDTLGTVVQGVVSYNIQVALDVPNVSVKPGMSDSVSVITNVEPDALLIPNAAVTKRQGSSAGVQLMAADGSVRQAQVVTGLSNDTMTEIISGLNEGDTVVTRTITQTAAPTASGGGFRIPGLGGGGLRGG